MHFLHVTTGVTLLGLVIASYYYLLRTYFCDSKIIHFTLKLTFILDLLLLPLIIFVLITGLMIGLPITVPWILSSCIYLSLVTLCLIGNIFLKRMYDIKFRNSGTFNLSRYFHIFNIVEIILLIIITHDMSIQG